MNGKRYIQVFRGHFISQALCTPGRILSGFSDAGLKAVRMSEGWGGWVTEENKGRKEKIIARGRYI